MASEPPRRASLRGQETALRAFEAALGSERVGGAYLLHGPEGVGRGLGAHLFAAALLCGSADGAETCGRCRSCRWVAAGTHPDLLIVSGDRGPVFRDDGDAGRARADVFTAAARDAAGAGPRKRIQVRVLRRLLEFLALAPAGGGIKVAVIDSLDDVEEEGAATLLKSLEDVPPRTVFLVLAESLAAVPDTILSRCQRLRFRPLDPDLVRELLRAGEPDLKHADVELLVSLAQGSAGRALRAAGMGVHRGAAEAVRDLLGRASPEGAERAVDWVSQGVRDLAQRRERLRELIALALSSVRDLALEHGGTDRLELLLPLLKGSLESVTANVAPELVVRSLWARAARVANPRG